MSENERNGVFDVLCTDENGEEVVCHEQGSDIWEVKETLEDQGMEIICYEDSSD